MSPARKRRNDDFAGFERVLRLQEDAQALYSGGGGGGHDGGRDRLKNECTVELEDYLKECKRASSDIARWITRYPTEKYRKESPNWKEQDRKNFTRYCRTANYLEISQYFDILGWWRDNSTRYPHIFVVAMIWLGVPATNAFQERVFSRASWYDSNRLMNQQSSKNFELRTLDSATRRISEEIHSREMIIRREAEEKRIAKGEKDGHEVVDLSSESDIDWNEVMVSKTAQLVDLTHELEAYNRQEDPNVSGPTVPSRFLVDRANGTFATMEDIEEFQDDDSQFTTSTIDPDGDNDIDLLNTLKERVPPATLNDSSVFAGDTSTLVLRDKSVASATRSPRKASSRPASRSMSSRQGRTLKDPPLKDPPLKDPAHIVRRSPMRSNRIVRRIERSPAGSTRRPPPSANIPTATTTRKQPPLTKKDLEKKRKQALRDAYNSSSDDDQNSEKGSVGSTTKSQDASSTFKETKVPRTKKRKTTTIMSTPPPRNTRSSSPKKRNV
jgi:hypothetical protein